MQPPRCHIIRNHPRKFMLGAMIIGIVIFLAWKDDQIRFQRRFLKTQTSAQGLSISRTRKSIACWAWSKSLGYSAPFDKNFDPWPKIAGSRFEPYYERFAVARDAIHLELIKADIDCEIAANQ